jgi:hypothetical protein
MEDSILWYISVINQQYLGTYSVSTEQLVVLYRVVNSHGVKDRCGVGVLEMRFAKLTVES